ncbi:MAG: methyl-accepting chemotaxis protein [Kangiellaceae bacterium]|jgi:methyl-accepting chemotaxis protein|nr:methyl-accepting chemotaxis protein [Kangiellaceae bacterium]
MQFSGSLQRKLIFSISGLMTLFLLVAGYLVAEKIVQLTEQKAQAEIADEIHLRAEEVKGFFVERSRVPLVALTDPMVLSWLSDHAERGSAIENDPIYQSINQRFKQIVSSDDTIKSIFMGSAKTFEYFYELGRVGVAENGPEAGDVSKGYFTDKRPWWHEAIQRNKLYITSPQVDATDNTVSSVIQMPIYNSQRQFIGVGGVDILITTVSDVINGITYNGEGKAFLLNEQQQVVTFDSGAVKLELNQPIASFDQVFSNSSGFSELQAAIASSPQGIDNHVLLGGEGFRVFYVPINSEQPQMNWTLGLLLPEHLINDSVVHAQTLSVAVVLIMLGALASLTFFVSKRMVDPIKRIANTMAEIADGDGDLTQRLDYASNDELGEMAAQFNRFVEKIQSTVQHTTDSVASVHNVSAAISSTTDILNQEVTQEQQQLDRVSASVIDMVNISNTIKSATDEANTAIGSVNESLNVVEQTSTQTQSLIADVAHSIAQATDASQVLNLDVQEIGTVLDVIKSIAEQTNLLALNAAIEAARAGEQGRGFAVVADEVRVLATKTQESTESIQQTVEKLKAGADKVTRAMEKSNAMSVEGEQQVSHVLSAVTAISAAVEQSVTVNKTIVSSTSEQQSIAQAIEASLDAIQRLAQLMVENSSSMSDNSQQLSLISTELDKTIKQFKV